jgi:hypothetical protein
LQKLVKRHWPTTIPKTKRSELQWCRIRNRKNLPKGTMAM